MINVYTAKWNILNNLILENFKYNTLTIYILKNNYFTNYGKIVKYNWGGGSYLHIY